MSSKIKANPYIQYLDPPTAKILFSYQVRHWVNAWLANWYDGADAGRAHQMADWLLECVIWAIANHRCNDARGCAQELKPLIEHPYTKGFSINESQPTEVSLCTTISA